MTILLLLPCLRLGLVINIPISIFTNGHYKIDVILLLAVTLVLFFGALVGERSNPLLLLVDKALPLVVAGGSSLRGAFVCFVVIIGEETFD